MDLLRFITAGSVDDGKSTFIGRLLYDSKSILVDQMETLKLQSKNTSHAEIDLALLTDGLRAEREQGITIDVAYKYFNTLKRKFIIADAPGHIQYTRNMVTGASHADCIVILIDARNGVIEQTRRHSIIASLLKIRHVVVAINKMDIMNNDEEVFNKIVEDYKIVAAELKLENVYYIPISALRGDNIIERSDTMPWFKGQALLPYLENIPLHEKEYKEPARFAVQYVIRPQREELHDYRGYAGRVSSGVYRKGDKVKIFPSGVGSAIEAIEVNGKQLEEAYAGQSIVLHLANDVDVSRGDIIVKENEIPTLSNELDVLLCWMDGTPLVAGNKYLLQHGTRRIKAMVKEITYKLDVNSLEKMANPGNASLNDVVRAKIKTAEPLAYDAFETLPENGSAILIDQTSNVTVGACLIQ